MQLRQYLSEIAQQQQRGKNTSWLPLNTQIDSDYLLYKTASAFLQTPKFIVISDVWLGHELFHIRVNSKDLIDRLENIKTDTKISVSLTVPYGISTADWAQGYDYDGLSFVWDAQKRKWQREKLQISDKDKNEILTYQFLQSLFYVQQEEAEPVTKEILAIEERFGKKCYVLRYTINPKILEEKGISGQLTKTIWIDTTDFFTVLARIEGKINGMYFLQLNHYQKQNPTEKFDVPSDIQQEVLGEREKIKQKIPTLIQWITQLRGWKPFEDFGIEFIDRVSLRSYVLEDLEKEYNTEYFAIQEEILKWLGLVPQAINYREMLVDSLIASVAGLYSKQRKKIFLGQWLSPELAETVLVHELVHAYQHTYYSPEILGINKDKLSQDNITALNMLLEGEAKAIQLEYILSKDGKSFKSLGDIFDLIENKILKDNKETIDKLQYSLYGYGANYIQYYLSDKQWNDLDKLFAKPPSTTQQLLHPYRSVTEQSLADKSAQQKEEVNVLTFPEGWHKEYEDSIGEFYLLMTLRQILPKEEAEEICGAWQNDKISIYRHNNGNRLFLLQIKWKTLNDAVSYAEAFKKMLSQKFGLALKEEKKQQADFLSFPNKRCYALKITNDSLDILGIQDIADIRLIDEVIRVFLSTRR
ncbi:MAG: hypothetical protein N2606_00865 [Candidatus Omnitrophica bacterium]|nr:hypothetical protein [Candidatus Omnitrophota bacterium]